MSAVDVFPLSTSAYIADTQHLSLLQDGAYLRIMMTMWRAGGWIDDDDRKLANICKLSIAKWMKIAAPVRSLLLARSGKLSQKRLLFEIEKELKRVLKNKQNGSAGGRAKALKSNPSRVATATVSAEPRYTPSESHLTLVSPSTDSEVQGRKKGRNAGTTLPDDWRPSATEIVFGQRLGLTQAQIESMAEDMRLWAKANANRAVGRKADWSATFKGWMKRDRATTDRRKTNNGAPSLLVRMMKRQQQEGYEDGRDAVVENERALPTGPDRQH